MVSGEGRGARGEGRGARGEGRGACRYKIDRWRRKRRPGVGQHLSISTAGCTVTAGVGGEVGQTEQPACPERHLAASVAAWVEHEPDHLLMHLNDSALPPPRLASLVPDDEAAAIQLGLAGVAAVCGVERVVGSELTWRSRDAVEQDHNRHNSEGDTTTPPPLSAPPCP